MTDTGSGPGPAEPSYELRAGTVGVRTMAANLRRRWWVLGLVVVVPSAILALTGKGWASLAPSALLVLTVLVILAVAAGCLVVYARSTITVTSTELVVRRVRRRVLPRAQVGEALLGFFGARPDLSPSVQQALRLAITDRDGRIFVRLPVALWPAHGLDLVLAALDRTPDFASRAHERLLTPWPYRHPVLVTLGGAIALLAVIVGGIVVYDHVERRRLDDDARAIERDWPSFAAGRLTRARFPHLRGVHASAAYHQPDIHLDVDVRLAAAGQDLPAEETTRLLRTVCAYHPPSAHAPLSREVDLEMAGTHRPLGYDCDADPTVLTEWLRWAQAHPLAPSDGSITVEQTGDADDDHQGPLALMLVLDTGSDAAFRAGLAHLCGFRPEDADAWVERGLSGHAERTPYAAFDVDCDRPAAALGQWRGSAEHHGQ